MATTAARRDRTLKTTCVSDAAKRRERAEKAVTRLRSLGDEFPEFARLIGSFIKAVESEPHRSVARDRARVLRAVREGYALFTEIVEETGLPREDVKTILQELEIEKSIVTRPPGGSKNSGRGGSRPLYFLPDVPAGPSSSLVPQGVSSFVGFANALQVMCE